jgi:hypothetical protein
MKTLIMSQEITWVCAKKIYISRNVTPQVVQLQKFPERFKFTLKIKSLYFILSYKITLLKF